MPDRIYRFINQFGSSGSGDGQFSFSGANYNGLNNCGIKVNANFIFVADNGNSRVQIFNNSAPYAYVGKFGSAGTGDGQFSGLQDLDIDGSHIYTLERANHRVQKFDINTYAFVAKSVLPAYEWNAITSDTGNIYVIGQLDINNPAYRVVTKSNMANGGVTPFDTYSSAMIMNSNTTAFYVCNNYQGTPRYSSKITYPGMVQYTFPTSNAFSNGITTDADRCYIVESNNSRVRSYDLITRAFVDMFGSSGSGELQFIAPGRITYYNNQLFVVDVGNYRVQIIDWVYGVAPNTPTGLIASCDGLGNLVLDWVDNG